MHLAYYSTYNLGHIINSPNDQKYVHVKATCTSKEWACMHRDSEFKYIYDSAASPILIGET